MVLYMYTKGYINNNDYCHIVLFYHPLSIHYLSSTLSPQRMRMHFVPRRRGAAKALIDAPNWMRLP